ncbi:kunitz-type protease inhibitor 2 [Triplophysa dalaica]|uniref:kunitz-type protease inhibitor 2 n=1 Tax=Triplophysa dalaica TaxID=1582913 RepID=UPI0024DFF050|nr:kunitz-type protease inhibitor 2 [Triplophysa dalaica]
MAQVWFTCVIGFLCCLPLLNACTWDPNTDVEQGLSIKSYDNGAAYLAYLPEISDDEECQQACCDRDECHLALIGTPADAGKSECRLVSCIKDGVDVCVLTPSTQFKVYRKIDSAGDVLNQNDDDVRSAFTTDDCRLPSVVGKCRAAFPRFYYNVTSQTCQQFVYGGCGGNNNNFETQEACETACSGMKELDSHVVSQRSRMSNPEERSADEPKALAKMTSDEFKEKCLASEETGPCRASMRRYFYKNGTCEQFIYGGCRGNKNNYETEEACMTTCTVTVIPRNEEAPVAPVTPSSPSQEACFAPAQSGPCRAAFRMFYFESSTQSCVPFIYGGCRGNQNRYTSEEECMSACSGNQWSSHGHPRRWTPAFFLVATLAIMSAVLLVGLILIAVRRGSRRFLVFDDKEELLPADEWSFEQSSKTVSN